MDYDSPAKAYDERNDANAPLYRVISVRQSTQLVRRRDRRVQTELILVSGQNRVAVRVDDVQYTGATKAARRWEVGDTVSIPNPKGLKSLNLSPDAVKPAPWDAARQRPRGRRRFCL